MNTLWHDLRFGLQMLWKSAYVITRYLETLNSTLFGVQPRDPLTFVVTAALLTVVALIACLAPARRATRIDPMIALRYE